MKRLHLILANLPPAELLGGNAYRRNAPALSMLLARGRSEPTAASLSAALGRAFGLMPDLPIAPYTLAHDGLEPGETRWMRADPVALQFYQDHLVLVGPDHLEVRRDEADTLVDTLNRHFAEEGLAFTAPCEERWYVRLDAEQTAFETQPIDAVVGRPIQTHMPRGPEAGVWRRRMNEIQMLLHDHPVNQAREAAGALPINSLWFWGAGRYAPLPRQACTFVASQQSLAQALAAAAGVHCQAMDRLEQLPNEEAAMVVLELPRNVNPEQAMAALVQVEQNWLRPAMNRLRTGALKQLRLETTGALQACREVTPLATWRFWQQARF